MESAPELSCGQQADPERHHTGSEAEPSNRDEEDHLVGTLRSVRKHREKNPAPP